MTESEQLPAEKPRRPSQITFPRSSSQESEEDAKSRQSSSSSKGGGRSFMFIDSSVDRRSSSEAVRVHVMRESHRTRRQLKGMQQASAPQGQMSFLATSPSEDTSLAAPTPRTSQSRRSSQGERRPSRQITPVSESGRGSPNLTRLVSIAEEHLARTQSSTFVSITNEQILDLCREDNAALNAFLALTIWEHTRSDQSNVDIESLEYEARALEALRQRISDTGDGKDGTIMTIALLSRFERLRGNKDTAAFHHAAQQKLVDERGGIEVLKTANENLVTALRRLGPSDES